MNATLRMITECSDLVVREVTRAVVY